MQGFFCISGKTPVYVERRSCPAIDATTRYGLEIGYLEREGNGSSRDPVMNVALINTNRIKPPIAPIGLEYVAEALDGAGHAVTVLDLCWSEDVNRDVVELFNNTSYELVGVSLRNTDDCAFTSRQSFLDDFTQVVATIRGCTDAVLVLGGAGFSVMAESILDRCHGGITAGIWGEGEFAFVELADRLQRKEGWTDVPALIRPEDGVWRRNPSVFPSLDKLPPMSRNWIDNRRYFREGGQAGVETKRGCTGGCTYCADPVAKGGEIRVRPPKAVVDELQRLLEQGIDHIHTCDSEFNLPELHAKEVCREIVSRRLGDRLRWYAYCCPTPFSGELAQLMKRAGCAGINFGADSGDPHMLRQLGRNYGPDDILRVARLCRDAGITVMFDLLLGGPGESEKSIARTIELMKKAAPDQTGINVGLRIYPGTPLWQRLGCPATAEPTFFIEPQIETSVFDVLDRLIGGDRRFFFFDPSKSDQNYNYNANDRLADAIRHGCRGAYWDILRKLNIEP